ncbi:hypothetical protein TNCV_3854721 [Trichonephila clavipes]|nr:hypothetical protein TNCV_3854721 [Trichonephila clavipes]
MISPQYSSLVEPMSKEITPLSGIVPVNPLGSWDGRPGARGLDKLDLTRFFGFKFRSNSAKRACRSSVLRARNELKSAQIGRYEIHFKLIPVNYRRCVCKRPGQQRRSYLTVVATQQDN